jgi:hypothetical protein
MIENYLSINDISIPDYLKYTREKLRFSLVYFEAFLLKSTVSKKAI